MSAPSRWDTLRQHRSGSISAGSAPAPPPAPASRMEQQEVQSAMLSGSRKQLTQADFVALESQVKVLRGECRDNRQLVGEVQAENKQLRGALDELNHRVATSTARLTQQFDDLRQSMEQRLGAITLESQATARELAALQTRVALLASSQESASGMAHEHASQLKDVAVLRTQQTFLQQSVERSEQSALETSRLMTQLRAELAGLQQRHAALASKRLGTTRANAHTLVASHSVELGATYYIRRHLQRRVTSHARQAAAASSTRRTRRSTARYVASWRTRRRVSKPSSLGLPRRTGPPPPRRRTARS